MELNQHTKEKLMSELTFEYCRSSGSGGQKVNKTESKAYLRWDISLTQSFDVKEVDLIKLGLENIINKTNEVVIYSDKHRQRERNKLDCISKLFSVIEEALTVDKLRIKRKTPYYQQKKNRVEREKQKQKKESRKKIVY